MFSRHELVEWDFKVVGRTDCILITEPCIDKKKFVGAAIKGIQFYSKGKRVHFNDLEEGLEYPVAQDYYGTIQTALKGFLKDLKDQVYMDGINVIHWHVVEGRIKIADTKVKLYIKINGIYEDCRGK